MNIDPNEFATYAFKEILTLKSQTMVLEQAVLALLQIVKPEACAKFEESLKVLQKSAYEEILINHPFLKKDFDDLMREAFS